jgi:hypothetical protein
MAVLFISHSSKDDTAATSLEEWLRSRGFTEIFIDHTSIVVGEKWAQALREASGTCRVVACLVTQPWLASDECFGEYKAAWYLGKRIIPLFLLAPKAKLGADAKKRFADIRAEYQGLDLTPCLKSGGTLDLYADQGVAERLAEGFRAAGALAKVGLDPEAFAIDRKLRPMPFLGLASFGDEDADAALFYGRSGDIAETLEELRQMRAKAERRPFVILGASGAGKSSLLKAGIIPRLRREAPAWLPLRAFRPGADPLLNFAESLTRTLADFGVTEALGDMRSRLDEAWRKAARGLDGRLTPEGLGALQAALEAEGRHKDDAFEPEALLEIAQHIRDRFGIAPIALEHMMSDRPAVDQNQTNQHLRVARLAIAAVAMGADLGRPPALEIGRGQIIEHHVDLQREQVASACSVSALGSSN